MSRAAATVDTPDARIAPAQVSRVTGTLRYRDRMLLKPGSVVEVWLLDTSLADAEATEIAYQRIDHPGQQLVRFQLRYDPADIREDGVYSVRAEVRYGEALLYTTDTHYPVLTRGAGDVVEIQLVRVATPPPRQDRASKPDSSLANTYWKLTSIDGKPFTRSGDGREPHLMLVRDLTARGSSGCNTFTGGYETYAGSLRFGNLATTRMACPSGMDIEQRFLDALTRVDRYDIDGESMLLYAGDQQLLGFAATYF
ncbi:MAG: META domain-containing protein [Pseudomonadota bacterium]